MFYSTGCSHAPHQVPAEWSDKYRGRFDAGWDAYREQTFARQKQLGVIPGNAELTPRPAALPAWDSLSAEEKELYARQMEVYAGFQENADWNVGRLLDAIQEMGELDDTLVIYIWGDNGASMEGTAHRLVQRAHHAKRHPAHPRAAALPDRAVRRPGRLGLRQHRAALRVGLGLGRQLPLPVGQAGRQPPGRHA